MMVLLRAPALFPTSSPYILQLPSELERVMCVTGSREKESKEPPAAVYRKKGDGLERLFSKSNKLTGRWGPRSHIFLP